MAGVLVILQVRPESPEVDINALAEKVKKKVEESGKFKVLELRIEPFAFGLNVIRMKVVIPEEEGAQDYLESIIKSVEGVEDVEVELFTRI
ncbi:MAG: elongation factor 1-beta [bacterium]|nr:elongation factor 1-beta [bacterium]